MELIKINNYGGKQTVNLRDLWIELKSKQEFANWKKSRLEGFVEDYDFLTTLSKSTGGRPSKEYHVTIEVAKHISMMERNDEGMRVRKYFIDCEKKSLEVRKVPTNFKEALYALIESEEEKERLIEEKESLKQDVERMQPMAEYGHGIYSSKNLYTTTNIATEIGLSARALNLHLKRLGVKKKGTGHYTDWELHAKYSKYDLVKYNEHPGKNSQGQEVTFRSLRWTRRGFDWLKSHADLIIDKSRKSLPLPKLELVKR